MWNSGNLPYLVANTYGVNFIKIEGIWFFRGQKPPIRGLTIIKRSWNYGNLPYLMANTYGLNFIKIGGIWIFRGAETPLLGGGVYIWPVMPIFELGCTIPVKSHVWNLGLDWLKSEVCWFSGGDRRPLLGGLHVTCDAHFRICPSYSNQKSCVKICFWLVEPFKSCCVHRPKKKNNWIFRGQKSPVRGGWHLMPIFKLGWAIPVKSHVRKFGLDWFKLEVSKISGGSRSPPLWGVTCEWWCPFSYMAELFQLKFMCENLARIGWAFQELSCKQTKKKITKATESNTFGKIIFQAVIIIITSKVFRLWTNRRRLTIFESMWNSGNLPYLVANTYGVNFIKIGGIWFFRGQKPPIRELTIIKRSWNYGNLPYLVANTYGLNFIKIGGSWILGGGGLHLTCDAHFRTRMRYSSQKSCVKIWFGLVEIGGMLIF